MVDSPTRNRVLQPIIIADDDAEDQALAQEAFAECRVANPLLIVDSGADLLDYLLKGKPIGEQEPVRPALIILDLKMPGTDGFDVLKAVKSNPDLRSIPIVVLTTSGAEEDVSLSYQLGVNTFIRKPVTFDALVEAIRTLKAYWFEVSELPPQ
jgi:CheY-like chemotaxis protein